MSFFSSVSSDLMPPYHCWPFAVIATLVCCWASWASVALSKGARRCSATSKAHTPDRLPVSLSRNLGPYFDLADARHDLPLFFLFWRRHVVVGAII